MYEIRTCSTLIIVNVIREIRIMNTETIHCSNRTTSSLIAAIANCIRGLLGHRQAQPTALPTGKSIRQGDLLRNLPINEKLRLGMYHYMD